MPTMKIRKITPQQDAMLKKNLEEYKKRKKRLGGQ